MPVAKGSTPTHHRSRFGNRSRDGLAIGPAGTSGPVRRPAGPKERRSGGPAGPQFGGSGRSLYFFNNDTARKGL